MPEFAYQPDDFTSLADGSADASGTPMPCRNARQINWSVKGTGTLSAGTVYLESAPTKDYAGTWNEVDSILASSLSGGKVYSASYPPPDGFVRVRRASVAGGGTVEGKTNKLVG